VERESKNLGGKLISISNSSDPYPPLEKKLLLTRGCLKILSKHNCKVQIVTKSDMVKRDVDILKRMRSCVSITITTLEEDIWKKLEPRAPSPEKRIKAIEKLIGEGIPVVVRIDPIIPFLNEEQAKLIKILSSLGVKQIISSTYKVRPDNWRRFTLAFPEVAKKLRELYFKRGERFNGYIYLPKEIRIRLMRKIKRLSEAHGMKFSCCREGFPQFNSAPTCDGSWTIS